MTIAHPQYSELRQRLYLSLGLNAVVILAEFAAGWWLNSIGLMSDAGHNLIDQGSLFLALYAHILAARPATEARTFGYHRAGIISAFVSSAVLLLTALAIAALAVKRILTPVPVQGGANVTTLAGNGNTGFQDADGINARFSSPFALAIKPGVALYVGDDGDHRVRKVDLAGANATVTTIAGTGTSG